MKNGQKLPKSAILAQLIYEAIVRYIKAKKASAAVRNRKFSLDFNRVWRGNVNGLVDGLEKENESGRR